MKNMLILSSCMLLSLSCNAQDIKSVINYEVAELEAKGCSVNHNGAIVNELSNVKYKVLIPYTDCNGDGQFSVLANIYTHKDGDRWLKEPAGDTSSEKVTDYNGMASITERIEYTAPTVSTTIQQ